MAVFAQSDEINIIPKPVLVNRKEGSFKLNKSTKIFIPVKDYRKNAELLNNFLERNYSLRLTITEKPQTTNVIALEMFSSSHGQPIVYDYSLIVDRQRINILGDERGQFYAIQSLFQLLSEPKKGSIEIPVVTIGDAPRFKYRGMHLDVGRHFMPVAFVKKYIDLMSQYKFNYFHWHLTEDQGWRIEIKKYPKLTEIGSKRPESAKEHNLSPYIGDGVPHEGFYTQEQIKDVVAYAKARYITVIPEIELPGHSSAALAAYPELGCKADYQYKVQTTWGIFKEVYCPTEKTFSFLEDVLTEVIGLFPDSPYIHIGGDEVLKDQWKDSPEVKELMARENLKDEHEVQSYFIRRMEKFINSKGKKIIGWDEILEGGLAPNATVMSWRGFKGGIAAAKERHDVIMTPTDYCYFDYGQGDPATEPINIGGYLPLEKVYGYDPVPKDLTPDEVKYIIGGQGNVWTEYLPTPASVEYMAFPRMIALSEVLWSTPENKNFADFSKRLSANLPRLDKQNVHYRIPEPRGLKNVVLGANDHAILDLTPPVSESRMYYTTDGTIPDPATIPRVAPTPDHQGATLMASTRPYENPVELRVISGGSTNVKLIAVLPDGRTSSVYAATYLRRDYLPGVEIAEKRPGVTYGIVSWRADGVPEPLVTSGETKTLGLQQFAKTASLTKPFAVTFDGYFNAPIDGIYDFQAESTFSTSFEIDGFKLIDGTGTAERKVRSNIVPLKAGLHKIGLRYANSGGEPFFRVRWGIKGQGMRAIGGGELFH